MGIPQGSEEASTPAVSTPADPKAAEAGWNAAAKATEGAVSTTEAVAATAATSEVAQLKGQVAALEQRIESLVSSVRDGLHNRVNEIEQTIKRKFPYG